MKELNIDNEFTPETGASLHIDVSLTDIADSLNPEQAKKLIFLIDLAQEDWDFTCDVYAMFTKEVGKLAEEDKDGFKEFIAPLFKKNGVTPDHLRAIAKVMEVDE